LARTSFQLRSSNHALDQIVKVPSAKHFRRQATMNPFLSPIVVADLFDRFRLQLPDPIVNWLTPVWILCVGATAGLILTAALWGIFWLLSRLPGAGTLAEQPASRRLAAPPRRAG